MAQPSQLAVEKLNIQTFRQMLHKCLDEMCGRQGPKYEDFCRDISEDEFQLICTSLKHNLCEYIRRSTYTWMELSPSYLECLRDVLVSRSVDVHTLRISQMCLKDYDWNIKYVMGSSTLAALQQPLLTLCLSDKSQSHSIEMDSTELAKFLSILQQARDMQLKSPAS